ncbi:MKL1 protein, partial [Amia calva]|nr:MKL1 protein [Amia calva]
LKSPAAFHEQRRNLERARTEDYLKRKIGSRPERSELVRMHILEGERACLCFCVSVYRVHGIRGSIGGVFCGNSDSQAGE